MSLLTLPAKAGEVDFALGITGNFADFDTTGSETEGWGYGDVIAGTETTSTSPNFFAELSIYVTPPSLKSPALLIVDVL